MNKLIRLFFNTMKNGIDISDFLGQVATP